MALQLHMLKAGVFCGSQHRLRQLMPSAASENEELAAATKASSRGCQMACEAQLPVSRTA
jgi:hypothetical protein